MRILRSAAVVAVAAAALFGSIPTASARGDGDAQRVRIQDDCDPATFNAAIEPGTCVGRGDVTFDRFVAALATGGHEHWRFHPSDTHIDAGGRLNLVNQGGEFHTFTEVAAFGPGCVPFLNDGLGLTGPPAMDCADPTVFAEGLTPGARSTVRGLSVGTHLFECAIHPWMTAVVEVRADD